MIQATKAFVDINTGGLKERIDNIILKGGIIVQVIITKKTGDLLKGIIIYSENIKAATA